jgi:hypothetical protein
MSSAKFVSTIKIENTCVYEGEGIGVRLVIQSICSQILLFEKRFSLDVDPGNQQISKYKVPRSRH